MCIYHCTVRGGEGYVNNTTEYIFSICPLMPHFTLLKQLCPSAVCCLCYLPLLCLYLLLSFLLAGLPFLVIETSTIKPYKRGFYCNDESIKYPYKNGETISDAVLCAAGILITILSVSFQSLWSKSIVSFCLPFAEFFSKYCLFN